MKHFERIEHRHKLPQIDFHKEYLSRQKPVLISGMMDSWQALQCWDLDYFARKMPDLPIVTKQYQESGAISVNHPTMKEYVESLNNAHNEEILPYCHDIPIFFLEPTLTKDTSPFPYEYLPKWYQKEWWKYIQFFVGPANSLTPLHFDCLLTNNLFFQVSGKKKFTLLTMSEGKYCGRRGWRWYDLDPENPNAKLYPHYKQCKPMTIIVNPGDILFMPAGTLHHVRSLDKSISFNIDFHTTKTSINSMLATFKGMPIKNVYYNFLCFLGIACKLPPRLIFRYYKSYLNYIS